MKTWASVSLTKHALLCFSITFFEENKERPCWIISNGLHPSTMIYVFNGSCGGINYTMRWDFKVALDST